MGILAPTARIGGVQSVVLSVLDLASPLPPKCLLAGGQKRLAEGTSLVEAQAGVTAPAPCADAPL
jgi:hypothetical protein